MPRSGARALARFRSGWQVDVSLFLRNCIIAVHSIFLALPGRWSHHRRNVVSRVSRSVHKTVIRADTSFCPTHEAREKQEKSEQKKASETFFNPDRKSVV